MSHDSSASDSSYARVVYTSGQVAKILCCCSRTINKCIDSGKMKGFRVPGGKDRRVTHESLVAFMVENEMPMYLLPEGKPSNGWSGSCTTGVEADKMTNQLGN